MSDISDDELMLPGGAPALAGTAGVDLDLRRRTQSGSVLSQLGLENETNEEHQVDDLPVPLTNQVAVSSAQPDSVSAGADDDDMPPLIEPDASLDDDDDVPPLVDPLAGVSPAPG